MSSYQEKKAAEKLQYIEDHISFLEKSVFNAQQALYLSVLDDFLMNLTSDDNYQLLNDASNIRLVNLLDKIYNKYNYTTNLDLVKTMINDINNIIDLNTKYFRSLSSSGKKTFKVTSKKIKAITYKRLGLDNTGNLLTEGYMQGLLDNSSVKNQIKDFAYKSIITGSGFENLKTGLKQLIIGDPERLGAFQKFFKVYAYDTYSQVDAMNGKLYADALGLKYFIYNGGIIKTTRCFCYTRSGNTYSTAEASKWDPSKLEDCGENRSKKVQVPVNYNFFIDRGSYGCRHSIDYISKKLAFKLRPDLGPEKIIDAEVTYVGNVKDHIHKSRLIYEKPLMDQYSIAYKNPKYDTVVNVHELVNQQASDFNEVMYASKAFIPVSKEIYMLPVIHPSEVNARNKILKGISTKTKNPDLLIDGKFLDVKSPKFVENILRNANKASNQGAEVVITDSHINLNDEIIRKQAESIFKDENYKMNTVHFVINGSLTSINRTAK